MKNRKKNTISSNKRTPLKSRDGDFPDELGQFQAYSYPGFIINPSDLRPPPCIRGGVDWGENVAIAFEQRIKDFFEVLKIFPEMGTVELAEKGIRGFQVAKQTRVFYRIKGEKIIILNFFEVRQDPKKKFQ